MELFIQRWNANKLGEMVADHYIDDAVMLPPNHEPVYGHQAILACSKSVRDVVGEIDPAGEAVVDRAAKGRLHDSGDTQRQ